MAGNIALEEAIAQLTVSTVDVNRSIVEMSKKLTESHREVERLLAKSHQESHQEVERLLAKSRQEMNMFLMKQEAKNAQLKIEEARRKEEEEAQRKEEEARRKEEEARRKEETERWREENARYHKDVSDEVKIISANVGSLNNRLGELMEYVVVPGIRPAFEDLGIKFTELAANKSIRADKHKIITEVDLLLYNDTEAMAVEIKTVLTIEKVKWHLERLDKLRKWEDKADIKGKTLYGAIAGMLVDDEAWTLALDNGLYAIKIHERSEQLSICGPEQRGTW
jgi:hypothetical protein